MSGGWCDVQYWARHCNAGGLCSEAPLDGTPPSVVEKSTQRDGAPDAVCHGSGNLLSDSVGAVGSRRGEPRSFLFASPPRLVVQGRQKRVRAALEVNADMAEPWFQEAWAQRLDASMRPNPGRPTADKRMEALRVRVV